MDALTHLLGSHRGRDAFVLTCAMDPPWSVRIADGAAVGLVVMTAGTCVLRPASGPAVTLAAGDVAVVRGPEPYDLADGADRPPVVVVEPGQRCRVLDPRPGIVLGPGGRWGNRTGGTVAEGGCSFVAGAYERPGQVSGRLLDALPPVAVLPSPACAPALVQALAGELERPRPGGAGVVDRYVDLVLVEAVRAWFGSPAAQPPRWWSAASDPLVAHVLALVHESPAEPWTLERLAAEVGCSRAGLSRRFRAAVGESPIGYLTGWRLDVAAERLTQDRSPVEAVARSVGYANAFAFSTAFKRRHGCSPRQHREAAATVA